MDLPQEGSRVRVFLNETTVPGLRDRQPALFVDPARDILQEPTLFLHREYVQSGRRSSPESWEAAAYALQSWFDFIWATGRPDWRDADRETLIAYRDAYTLAISPKTGAVYASGTIANRMSVILAFYRHAAELNLYDGDLIIVGREQARPHTAISDDFLVHTSRGIGDVRKVRGLLPKRRISRSAIRPFSVAELRSFLNTAGPRASDRAGDRRPTRTRIAFDLGWSVGLRLDEIIGLKRFPFMSMTPDSAAPAAEQITQVLGKGNVLRPVAIPNWLVFDILEYMRTERKEAIEIGGLTGRKEPGALLVAGLESNSPGKPISHRRLQQEMETTCLRSGITETVGRVNAETGVSKTVTRAKHCVHDLRHTYAVLTYHAEVKGGNAEPWKKIQAQLGHKFLSTTMNTYLGFVSVLGSGSTAIDLRKLLSI